MNHHQIRGFDMLDRVFQYFDEYPLAISVARVTALRAELDVVRARARFVAAAQDTGHTGFRAGSAERQHLVEGLLREMRDINALARAMDPVEFAGASELFRMPRSQAVGAIVARAFAFVEHARTMEDAFLERGRPAGFLEEIEESIAAVQEAAGPKNEGLLARVGATAELNGLLSRALAIRRELNAILTPLLRENPAALGGWKTAQHVARAARRKQNAPQPQTENDPTPVGDEEPARGLSPRLDQPAARVSQANHVADSQAENPNPSIRGTDQS